MAHNCGYALVANKRHTAQRNAIVQTGESIRTDFWAEQTDRIIFDSFYPFLAYIAASFREPYNCAMHPALHLKVSNKIDINSQAHPLVHLEENGPSATPVFLSQDIRGTESWWPLAPSVRSMEKLWKRIANEGMLVATLLPICIALVSEIYTTSAIQPSQNTTPNRCARLNCCEKPVTDFGIVQGRAFVTGVDRLLYHLTDINYPWHGQDPDDHYRIYIRTSGNAEWYLDLGMYTFNMACVVDTAPYRKYNLAECSRTVPGYFVDKKWTKPCGAHSLLFEPKRYMSVLRDPRAHRISLSNDFGRESVADIVSMMEEIAGRRCRMHEIAYASEFLSLAIKALRQNMCTRDWVNFSPSPKVDFETDEDEEGVMDATPEKEALVRFTNRWAKKVKKGKETREHFSEVAHNLANLPQDVRLKKLGVQN
uniref:Uncharacterized protein n=1 Tax=Psilocybe cubensis TaxID=181762 RepID=A0A8H8CGZ4_PSICU